MKQRVTKELFGYWRGLRGGRATPKRDEVDFGAIRHLLADRADAHEKKMMGGIAFMVKGGMACAAGSRAGMLVRVVPQDQPGLIKQPDVKPMVMGGRKVASFVRVTPDGYRTHAALKKWVQRGLAAVAEVEMRSAGRKRNK